MPVSKSEKATMIPPVHNLRPSSRETGSLKARHIALLATITSAATAQLPHQWQQLQLAGSQPSARSAFGGLIRDDARGNFVLFGGDGPQVIHGDTWTFDGQTWTLAATTGPSPRRRHALAYHSATQQVLLFGGMDANNSDLSDTWVWDGTQWSSRSPSMHPVARHDAALVEFPPRSTVMLVGGTQGLGGVPLVDEWEWTGTTWTGPTASNNPPMLFGSAGVYDSARQRIVVFGGINMNGANSNLTWEYDGTSWSWTQGIIPSPRRSPAMSYSPSLHQTLMFGGMGTPGTYPNMDDLWAYNGVAWSFVAAGPPGPLGRSEAGLAYDPSTAKCFLAAGTGNLAWLQDVWSLSFPPHLPASASAFGLGCPGSVGTPTLAASSLPRVGFTFGMGIDHIPPVAALIPVAGFSYTANTGPFGTYPLPRDFTAAGMNGCSQFVSDDFVSFRLGLGGHFEWTFPIPAGTAFVGQVLYLQVVVQDYLANPAGLTVTNAVEAHIGF